MKTIRQILNSTFLWAGISVLILSGCGYDPKDPVYDTVANPDSYPPAALSLLGDIESGGLVTIDSISSRFADLYTSESDLLDNSKWKQVIERLGARLSYKADNLVLLGLSEYDVAAGYYSLAYFARPQDAKMYLKAGQFGVWSEVIADYDDSASSIIENRATISDKIEFIRRFWSRDALSRIFASSYLLAQLFDWPVDREAMSKDEAKSLSAVDLALARVLKLTTYNTAPVLASFAANAPDAPAIDLVAARVKMVAPTQYMVEAYFMVKERVSEEYTISVRAGTARGSGRLFDENLSFVPFEAIPLVPIRQWRADEIYAVFLRFDAPVEPTGVAIGFFETNSKPVRFIPTTGAGKESDFVLIPGLNE